VRLDANAISWKVDRLQIDIKKSKMIQAGARRGVKHVFSVYCNPNQPEICVFVALGIHLLTSTKVAENAMLFEGAVYTRFAAWVKGYFKAHPDPKLGQPDFGTQSFSKGALSYACLYSGSMSAGYQPGGVLTKYRYVSTIMRGDENVGRLICGLNNQTLDYTLLPPRFKPTEVGDVGVPYETLIHDYASYPASFKECIPYLIATMVYHCNWLKQNLPKCHPLFLSRGWRSNWMQSNFHRVLTPVPMECKITNMRATGIEPVHAIMHSLHVGYVAPTSSCPSFSSGAAPVATAPALTVPAVAAIKDLKVDFTELKADFTELQASIDELKVLVKSMAVHMVAAGPSMPPGTAAVAPLR
jgi:hypothetical protein